MKTTVAQLLKYDFSKGQLKLYDANGNLTYREWSDGYWFKQEFDANGKVIYFENSDVYWSKHEFDSNGNEIYYENSYGDIIDKRPKKDSCNGKVVEIDGKKYKLTEL